MHRAGVVHRDVKPHNVVILRGEDGGESAKLIDLGLAKPLRGKYKTLTALATAIGTPAFMSPEQVTGEATIDVRTDVYSAAATFVALATGRTLYDDRGHAILGAVVERRRLPVHRVAVDLPAATCAVLSAPCLTSRRRVTRVFLRFRQHWQLRSRGHLLRASPSKCTMTPTRCLSPGGRPSE